MSDRPILFSGPMVRALLDKHKTQTRRVLNPQPAADFIEATIGADGLTMRPAALFASPTHKMLLRLPRPGDRLWLREAWRCNGWATDFATIFYRASEGDGYTAMCEQIPVADHQPMRITGTWHPGIHMPQWASRLTLLVTDVRVERLQDISEEDARAEGCWPVWSGDMAEGPSKFADEVYRELWDSLNAKRGYGWDANPWVVVVSFDVVKANIDRMPNPPLSPLQDKDGAAS